jgi:hypothetical protein
MPGFHLTSINNKKLPLLAEGSFKPGSFKIWYIGKTFLVDASSNLFLNSKNFAATFVLVIGSPVSYRD